MSIPKYDGDGTPKPSAFPPRLDVRIAKELNLADSLADDSQDFNQLLKDNLDVEQEMDTDDDGYLKTLTSKERKAAKGFALVKSARFTANIYESLNFFSREVINKIEITNSRFNYEDVKGGKLDSYKGKTKNVYNRTAAEALSAALLGIDYEESLESEESTAVAAEGNTLLHNLNPYTGMGTNPFKREDTENWEIFENNPYFRGQHDSFLSPANILGEDFVKSVNRGVDNLQNQPFIAGLARANIADLDSFASDGATFVSRQVDDPYMDNDIEKITLNMSVNDLIYSERWRSLSEEDTFNVMHRMREISRRFENTRREMFGFVYEAFADMDDASDIESVLNLDYDDPEAEAFFEEHLKSRVDVFLNRILKHLDSGDVLPYTMFNAMLKSSTDAMDFSNIDRSYGTGAEFEDKFTDDFLNQTYENYITPAFFETPKLTVDDFLLDERPLADYLFETLQKKGFITASGEVTSKIKSISLSEGADALALAVPKNVAEFAFDVLTEGYYGASSFYPFDQTVVNGKKRLEPEFKVAEDEYYTFSELLGLMNKGETSEERKENFMKVMPVFTSMVKNAYGLNSSEFGDGELKLTQLESGLYEMEIYDEASWQEWRYDNEVGSYVDAVDQPYTMTFKSRESAENFMDNIRKVVAYGEPFYAMFGDRNGDLPLEVLVDNSGSADSYEFIQEGDSRWKMGVDHMVSSDFYDTGIAQHMTKYAEFTLAQRFMEGSMSPMIANSLFRDSHDRKVEDWKEKEEEYYEEEYAKIRRENEENRLKKEENSRRKEDKELEMRAEASAKEARAAQARHIRELMEEKKRRRSNRRK